MRKSLALLSVVIVGSAAIWFGARGQFGVAAHAPETPIDREEPDSPKSSPREANTYPQLLNDSSVRADASPLDPIIVAPCTLHAIQVQDVATQLDGQIVDIPVTLGQKVAKGACLARLDNRKLLLQTQLLEIRATSLTDELIARALFEEAEAKVAYAEKANKDNVKAVPELELKTYVAQRERFAQETKKAQEERQAAKKELEKGQLLLEQHNLTSSIDGEVVKILRKPGETVKQAETIFRVSRMDHLSIEGYCKVQNAHQLRVGMPVSVEPELQGRQVVELVGHTDTVSDIAVSADGKIVASASFDGKVLLWSWPGGQRLGALVHPAPVHAIDLAVDGQGNYLVLTGCEDGRARLWTVSARAVLGQPREFKGHEGALRTVRIRPDGQTCVTAADDRKIGLWNLASGQRLGWLHAPGAFKQSAHQGAITGLQVGADGLLVSAGTDNVQKVWKISGEQAELLKAHRGRSGDVLRPGLSPDGKQMVFDHGDELRLLDPASGTVHGIVESWKNTRFQEFAAYSPTGRLILTASADGRLGLWKAPQGRAASFEISHYLPPRVSKVKCAAFAPDEKTFFSGGTGHVVRAWAVPESRLWQPRQATLTYVGSEIEQGTDLVRIQADLPNPADGRRLFPGTLVVLKIYPQGPER